mgnify:CR=1 FL=1
MTSLEKINLLIEIEERGNLARIITIEDENLLCKPICFAEDEADWAYDVKVLNDPTRDHVILEGNFIESIEEVPA